MEDWSSQFQDFVIEHFSFAVPLFFLLSGYWFMKSYEKYGWTGLLSRKLKTLYIPFVCWCLIGELAVLPSALFASQSFSWEAIAGIPVLLMNGLHLSWHLWYVRGLILFFLLAPICFRIGQHWLLFGAIVVLTRVSPAFSLGPYEFGYVSLAVPWFFLGCLCSTHNLLEKVVPRRIGLMLVIFSVMGVIVLDLVGAWQIPYCPSSHEFRIVFLVAAFWFGYDLLEVRKTPPNWLQTTFFVYCLHTCVIRYTGNGLRYALGISPMVKALSFCLNFFSFWVDVLIAALIMRFLPRIYKPLSGGR